MESSLQRPFSREDPVPRMRSRIKPVFATLTCLLLIVSINSCGGSNFFPSQTAVVALSLSPTSGVVQPNNTVDFTATGTLGNNQTQDVTSTVTWTSSSPTVATVKAGVVTGVALGTTTITASSNHVSATASVLVSNITGITISPTSWSPISTGLQQQFTAQGSDGSNVTNSVAWTSSDTTCVTITSGGLATFVNTTGTSLSCTITATLGTFTQDASVSGL